MSFDGQSLSNASTQAPDVSANSSRGPGDLTSEDSKDLTVEQLAARFDITVDELVEAVSKHAKEIHHAARLALSVSFVELLYEAYAKTPNPIIETPQGNVGSGLQEKCHFLEQYDKWEKALQEGGHGSIYLNGKDRMRLCHAFESIASPGQDWSFDNHKALRDHINTVCPS